MPKYKWAVRRQIRDAVIQCRVKRFSRAESIAFVKAKTGEDISIRYLDTLIKGIKMSAPKQLAQLRESSHLFLDEVFKTRDEIEEYIKQAWILFHTHEGDAYLQLNCLKELHQLTISRSNIIDVLPHYSAMGDLPERLGRNKEAISSYILESSQEPNTRRGQAIF